MRTGGSKRSQLSKYVGRTTCLLAGARRTRFELPTSRLRKSSSQVYEQAARDEINVVGAPATGKSPEELRERTRWRVSQATRWKTREEVCSLEQRQNLKGMKGMATSICKYIGRGFGTTCQKFNRK